MGRSRDEIERIEEATAAWQGDVVDPRVQRFKIPASPVRFYTPADQRDFDFLEKVGFPGQYPFTAGNRAFEAWRALVASGASDSPLQHARRAAQLAAALHDLPRRPAMVPSSTTVTPGLATRSPNSPAKAEVFLRLKSPSRP